MGIFEFGHSVQCRVIYSQMNCCRWPVWSRRTDLVALSLWNITTRASRTLQPDAERNAMSHPYWTLVAVKSTSCQVITQALALLSSVVAVHLFVCPSVAIGFIACYYRVADVCGLRTCPPVDADPQARNNPLLGAGLIVSNHRDDNLLQ